MKRRLYDCRVTVRLTNKATGKTLDKVVTKPYVMENSAQAEAHCRSPLFVKQFVGTFLPLDKQTLVTVEVLDVVVTLQTS